MAKHTNAPQLQGNYLHLKASRWSPILIGYAHVPTQDQNLDFQREALAKAGYQKLFEDKVNGTHAGAVIKIAKRTRSATHSQATDAPRLETARINPLQRRPTYEN